MRAPGRRVPRAAALWPDGTDSRKWFTHFSGRGDGPHRRYLGQHRPRFLDDGVGVTHARRHQPRDGLSLYAAGRLFDPVSPDDAAFEPHSTRAELEAVRALAFGA